MKGFFELLLFTLPASFADSIMPPIAQCDYDWESAKLAYDKVRTNDWKEPPCYEFTLTKSFFGPIEAMGPFDVRVEDHQVMPSEEYGGAFIPTIEELFVLYFKTCLANCPTSGAAYCSIAYARDGHIVSLDITHEYMIADDGIVFQVSDFSLCPDEADADDAEDDFADIKELKKQLRAARKKKKKLSKLCSDTD